MKLDQILSKSLELQDIFSTAPDSIKNKCIIRNLKKETIIQKKDYPIHTFCILYDGTVKIINEFECGNIFVIEENTAIDFIGDVALLAGLEFASVTTMTLTNCKIIQLQLSDFHEWLEADINFLSMISKRVANKLYNSSYSKGIELYYPTNHLMLKLIIDHVNKTCQYNDTKMKINLSHQQIGEILGVTVRTVGRTIRVFKEANLLSIHKGKIEIDNKQYNKIINTYENKIYY